MSFDMDALPNYSRSGVVALGRDLLWFKFYFHYKTENFNSRFF